MTLKIEKIKKQVVDRYIKRTKKSKVHSEQAKQFLPGGDTRSIGYYKPYPVFGAKGKGCFLYDYDGNEYIDFVNNMTSLVNGHAHPHVVEALQKQIENGTAHGIPNEAQYQLAELITKRIPGMDKVRFNNSVSEATLFSMRAARAYTGKDKFLKIDGGYHGCHDFAQVNLFPDLDSPDFPRPTIGKGVPASVLQDILVMPYNNLEIAEKILREKGGEIAAIILEPLMGAGGGGLMAEQGYLKGLRKLADRYEVLLIFDEIITFRIHEGGWQAMEGVEPDITTLGKIIGGGLPVGAFGGREEIMSMFDPTRPESVTHSGTFTGNPMTMAAGLANLEIFGQKEIEQLNQLGEKFICDMNQTIKDCGIKGRLEGIGSVAVSRFSDRKVRSAKDAIMGFLEYGEFLQYLHLEMMNRGVYFLHRGLFNLSTPMTQDVLDKSVSEFGGAFEMLKPLSDAIGS